MQTGDGDAAPAVDPWPAIVAQAVVWGRTRALSWRDAVFLVPMAPHLPLARRAWARVGGWMPRVETTSTLALALAAPAASAGRSLALSFDVTADRLAAARLLRGQSWVAAWAQRDARGWAQALDALVATAHALWRAAAARSPDARDDHWQRGRASLAAAASYTPRDGPGGAERALLRVAFEWAQAAITVAPPATDALFALTPSAWVCVQSGGADSLAASVMAAAGAVTPCLSIDTDPSNADPLVPTRFAPPLHVGICSDFEDEAQRAAAQVLVDLERIDADAIAAAQPAAVRLPVALVSLDRMLVRRIRALLARRGVAIADETGWTLSTTRAAASLAGLLVAVQPQASADELLNGLRGCAAGWPGLRRGGAALAALEAAIRRRAWRRAAAIDPARLPPSAAALWQAVREAAAQFDAGPPRRSLAGWMSRLRGLLDRCGLAASLMADEAGRQVLAALTDSAALAPDVDADASDAAARQPTQTTAHGPIADGASLTREQFTGWLDQVLESATFVPAAPAAPHVVITPLVRAMLRPFAAIVVPGADDHHLGGPPPRQPLLSDAEAAGFGLPDAEGHRRREALAFAHLLRAAPVTVLHRHDDAGEPLAASPLLTRAQAARAPAAPPGACGTWHEAADYRVDRLVGIRPVARPLPAAPALLPARLSASACEALRACPYRFFGLRVLGLQESPELDDAVEKRDYGSWLHAVLYRFHAQRAEREQAADAPERAAGVPPTPQMPADPDAAGPQADAAALQAVAAEVQREHGLDAAAFLPYRASFDRFLPRYLAWLRRRDAAGARWLDGEREFSVAPVEWGGTLMHGVVDRIDSLPRPGRSDGLATQLIDYKTGAAQTLRAAAKRPQEDTQLAFYAGLLMTQSAAVGGAGELAAMYLALDESDALPELPHADVESTARQLIAGIGGDLARLRAGAAMPALGDGRACAFCEARGLCRRDQWAPA